MKMSWPVEYGIGSNITLSNGIKMPIFGLGTSKGDRGKVFTSVKVALDAGYRLIDTATFYANEEQIGDALREAIEDEKVTRDELFVITKVDYKIPPAGMHPDRVERFLRTSLGKLQLGYVDAYLIHMSWAVQHVADNVMLPLDENGRVLIDANSDFLAVWKKMEEMVEMGLTKSIGVSNFNRDQIQRILNNCRIPPVINQFEFHVYHQRPLLTEFCKSHRIAVIGFGPLGSPGFGDYLEKIFKKKQIVKQPNILEDDTLFKLSKKYGKSLPQIIFRWCIQSGVVPIPKSENEQRIKENIEVFDFKLLEDDIRLINGLERNFKVFTLDHHLGLADHPEFVAALQD